MSRIPDIDVARQSSNHLSGLLRNDREATALFVAALVEFDRNKHWVELGYNCLLNYVHHELRMSRTAAFFRVKAAGLVQRFPEVAEPLRDGRLCITAVVHLAKVMNEHNRAEVLPRFFHQTNRAAKEIVAELAPVLNPPRREVVTALSTVTHARTLQLGGSAGPIPDPMAAPGACSPSSDSRRELESSNQPASEGTRDCDGGGRPGAVGEEPQSPKDDPALPGPIESAHGAVEPPVPMTATPEVARAVPLTPAREMVECGVQPLTADLCRLHVTVTKGFLRKLTAARDALAHYRGHAAARSSDGAIGRNAEVLEAGLDLILRRDARNKGITSKPLKQPRPCAPDEIPMHVRREVGDRDHWQCQYPLDSGGICGSKRNVQIDHVRPRARGGEPAPANLRVLCAYHNALVARVEFGDEVMDRYTRRGRVPSP